MKDTGICELNSDGKGIRLEKEFYRQGDVFKSRDAYKNRPDAPCHVPELTDTVYTAEDFLRLCKGQKTFADQLFEEVDWQHPETLLEEQIQNGEWTECPNCGSFVDYDSGYADKKCSRCGAEVEEQTT